MELSAWLKTARKTSQKTQAQLAQALDVTKGNVSAWENGRHKPSYAQLLRISEITGVSLNNEIVAVSWPFERVSQEKIKKLKKSDLEQIEAILMFGAAQLGIDIEP